MVILPFRREGRWGDSAARDKEEDEEEEEEEHVS